LLRAFDKSDSGYGIGRIMPVTAKGFAGLIQQTDTLVIADGFNGDFGLFR
jgi:hypothetical protein